MPTQRCPPKAAHMAVTKQADLAQAAAAARHAEGLGHLRHRGFWNVNKGLAALSALCALVLQPARKERRAWHQCRAGCRGPQSLLTLSKHGSRRAWEQQLPVSTRAASPAGQAARDSHHEGFTAGTDVNRAITKLLSAEQQADLAQAAPSAARHPLHHLNVGGLCFHPLQRNAGGGGGSRTAGL